MGTTMCAICDNCGKHQELGMQTFDRVPVGWWVVRLTEEPFVQQSGAMFCSIECASRWDAIQRMRDGESGPRVSEFFA